MRAYFGLTPALSLRAKIAQLQRFATGILACAGLAGFSPVRAASVTEDLSDPDAPSIMIDGEIKPGDDIKFRDLAMKHERAIVFLNSPGGSIVPAIEIGKAIRLKEFATVVLPETVCTSACALIWVAGSDRFAHPSSKIGFHASSREVGGRQVEVGVGNAMVGRYLTQLNLPERAVIFATVASPDEIQWLEMKPDSSSGIEFTLIPEDVESGSTPASSPNPTLSSARASYKFEWEKAPWGVRSGEKGCTLLSYFQTEAGQSNVSSLIVHAYGDGNLTVMVMNEKFRSLKSGSDYRMKILFESQAGTFADIGYQQAEGFTPKSGSPKGFRFDVPMERILRPLTRYDSVKFYYEDREVDRFPLEGSSDAVSALRQCLMNLPM